MIKIFQINNQIKIIQIKQVVIQFTNQINQLTTGEYRFNRLLLSLNKTPGGPSREKPEHVRTTICKGSKPVVKNLYQGSWVHEWKHQGAGVGNTGVASEHGRIPP